VNYMTAYNQNYLNFQRNQYIQNRQQSLIPNYRYSTDLGQYENQFVVPPGQGQPQTQFVTPPQPAQAPVVQAAQAPIVQPVAAPQITAPGPGQGQAPFSQGQPQLGSVKQALKDAPPVPNTSAQTSNTITNEQQYLAYLNKQSDRAQMWGGINLGVQTAGMLGNMVMSGMTLYDTRKNAAWQKNMAERNYFNSVRSYNTAREDKVQGRYSNAARQGNEEAIKKQVEDQSLPQKKR
jgi:hypothetical protein